MPEEERHSRKQTPVNSREWFVLGIRLFGVWLLTRGVGYFASFIDFRFGLTGTPGESSPNSYLYYAACELALAAYFLLGARHLAGICERGGVDHHHEQNSGLPEGE